MDKIYHTFCLIFLQLIISCSSNPADRSENKGNEIMDFVIEEGQLQEAEIISDADSSIVKIYVEEGIDLSAVTPNITVSTGATIEPASGDEVDFAANENFYTYTVTSEIGEKQEWYVEIIEVPQKATFILLPDTQSYAQNLEYRPYFTSQIDWILGNKDDIDMVLQQGDLTNRNTISQWEFIESEFSRLNTEVPYILSVGNHDMGPNGSANNRNTAYFNQFFSYSTMSDLPAFGGAYPDISETDSLDNAYYLLETGQYKWLFLTLEFGARDKVLSWANDIVNQFSDRIVVLNTHAYMYSDDTRMGSGDDWNPHDYGIDELGPNEVNDGEEMWSKLVKGNDNVRFIFSGHVLHDGVGTLVSENDAGKKVYQFLANFQSGVQGSQNGGNGYLRKVTIDFKNDKLIIDTFSSYPDIGTHPNTEHNFEISPLNLD